VKLADSLSFVALAFLNGVEYRNSDFKTFIFDDLATSCYNFKSLSVMIWQNFGEIQSSNSGV